MTYRSRQAAEDNCSDKGLAVGVAEVEAEAFDGVVDQIVLVGAAIAVVVGVAAGPVMVGQDQDCLDQGDLP